MDYDYVAGSNGKFTVYCVDEVYDASTDVTSQTVLDLTNYVVRIRYKIDGGTTVETDYLTKETQVGSTLGKAYLEWGVSGGSVTPELTEGTLSGQVVVTHSSSSLQYKTPASFTLRIGPAL